MPFQPSVFYWVVIFLSANQKDMWFQISEGFLHYGIKHYERLRHLERKKMGRGASHPTDVPDWKCLCPLPLSPNHIPGLGEHLHPYLLRPFLFPSSLPWAVRRVELCEAQVYWWCICESSEPISLCAWLPSSHPAPFPHPLSRWLTVLTHSHFPLGSAPRPSGEA